MHSSNFRNVSGADQAAQPEARLHFNGFLSLPSAQSSIQTRQLYGYLFRRYTDSRMRWARIDPQESLKYTGKKEKAVIRR